MDDRSTREILAKFAKLEREVPRLRRGVVTDADPLSVALGGSSISYEGVTAIDGLALAVGDPVAVLFGGHTLWVVGRMGHGAVRGQVGSDGSVVRGTGFTATKNSTGVYTVTFSVAFSAIPIPVATPAGSTLGVNAATSDHAVGSFRVYCSNTAGSAADSGFTFVAQPA